MIQELKNTQKHLTGAGILSAQREAEYIFCHLLDCSVIDLYTRSILLNDIKQRELKKIIERRMKGEPLQYLLGSCCFCGFEFKVKKGVFIPRPETELLVDTAVRKLLTAPYGEASLRSALDYPLRGGFASLRTRQSTNILDLCTGSGNIAISLTKMLPRYKIFASDTSKEAVSLAVDNASFNNVNGKIEFARGDLFKPWKDKNNFFDAIICNPPYIKRDQIEDLPLDVKNEPLEALDGGSDGLEFYRKIAEKAPFYLKDNAYILLELSPDIAEQARDIFKQDFSNIELIKDYNNKDRIIAAQWINS